MHNTKQTKVIGYARVMDYHKTTLEQAVDKGLRCSPFNSKVTMF